MNAKNNILLVIDSEEMINLLRIVLSKTYNVLYTNSADEGFALIRSNDIKVIVADQYLPNKTGVDFFKDCAKRFPRIERILLTEMLDKRSIMDAINLGEIFHYVIKPVSPSDLSIFIDKAIEKSELRNQNERLIINLMQKNKEYETSIHNLEVEEEKFRNIFNKSNDPILIIDTNGAFIEINDAAREQLSISLFDHQGKILQDYVNPSQIEEINNYMYGVQIGNRNLFETKLKKSENKYYPVELNGHLIKFENRDAILLVIRDLTERREIEKTIIQTIVQTEEKERQRFAQELHDGIGPLLSTIKLYFQWLSRPDSKADKNVVIQKIDSTIEQTVASLREISNNLSPNVLQNFGLHAALKNFLDHITVASKIDIKFQNKINRRLDSIIESTIYRLVCECVNNSIKHAEPKWIKINIDEDSDYLNVIVEDRGKGFNMDEIFNSPKGQGLKNLKNRVKSLGGHIDIHSEVGKGTTTTIQFYRDEIEKKSNVV